MPLSSLMAIAEEPTTAMSPRTAEAMALLQQKNAVARTKALIVLGMERDPSSAEAIRQMLSDADSDVRRAALTALRIVEGSQAIDMLLLTAQQDRHPEVRRQAINELAVLADPSATPALVALLMTKKHPEVLIATMEAVSGNLKAPEAAEPIIKHLRHKQVGVRRAACKALGDLQAKEAVPALVKRTRDRDVNVRRAAIRALGDLGDTETVPGLMRALNDRNSRNRDEAYAALKEVYQPDVFESYAALLDSSRSLRRAYGARLVAHSRHPQAQAVLEARLVKEWRPDIRSEIRLALNQLEEQPAP